MTVADSVRSRRLKRRLLASLMLVVLLAAGATGLAQDDERVGAPTGLSAGTTEAGIVLSWDAPLTTEDEITGYEISGLHVRRGVGIVEEFLGITDGQTTTWTDLGATDPDLLYVYRVRPLFGDVEGRWSSFLITGFEQAPPEPTPVVEFEPTSLVPRLPEEPAVEPAPAGPTEVIAEAPLEPTVAPPPPEPTPAADEQAALRGSSDQDEAPPAALIQQQAADLPLAPTAAPPQLEPTAAGPEPEATHAPPLAPLEPTGEGPGS